MHNTYRLAGHTVEIESVYPQVHTLCADYRTDDPPEYVITTTEADIAYERQRSARADKLISATGCMCTCGAICSTCAQRCCGAVTCPEE